MLDTVSNKLQKVRLRLNRPGTCLRISGLYRKQISTRTLDSSDTIMITTTNTERITSAVSILCAPKLTYLHFVSACPALFCSCEMASITHNRVHASPDLSTGGDPLSPLHCPLMQAKKADQEDPDMINICLGVPKGDITVFL